MSEQRYAINYSAINSQNKISEEEYIFLKFVEHLNLKPFTLNKLRQEVTSMWNLYDALETKETKEQKYIKIFVTDREKIIESCLKLKVLKEVG